MVKALHSSKMAPMMVFNGEILHEDNIWTALLSATLVKSAAELSSAPSVVGSPCDGSAIESNGVTIFITQKIPV
jgi:hypothetical protein